MYILYSPRSQGWFTKSSTYTSDVTQAMRFDREDAIALCKRHKHQGSHNMIPVREEDISAI